MFTPVQLFVLYLLVVTVLLIVGLVEWAGSGELKKVYGQCRRGIGFPIFLLSAYCLPLLLAGEMVSPGLLNELRPLIFKPGQIDDLRQYRKYN